MMWGSAKPTQTKQRLSNQNSSGASNVDLNGNRFESKSALYGLTKEHFRFSSETWEANDGVPIFLRRVYCGSSKNAERALSETAKTALEVFDTRTLRNSQNEASGRRIVVSFDKELPRQRVIFWTKGEMLYSVESSSFDHALLFEKMFPGL
jgi:hypothetical protein